MKLTEVFAKKTYRDRGEAPSVDVGHLDIQEFQSFIRSLKLEPIPDVAEYPWHPTSTSLGAGDPKFVQHILTTMSKGWNYAKFYRTPQGILLVQHQHGDWSKSKIKWSKQRLLSHLGNWWGKSEIQTN